MSRRMMPTYPTRAQWTALEDNPVRPGGKPNRPLTCLLIGGVVEYANIRKLPDFLWDAYGIAVVEHIEEIPRSGSNSKHDLVIVLREHMVNGAGSWAKTASDHVIHSASSASRLGQALEAAGFLPYRGSNFGPPTSTRRVPSQPPPMQETPVAVPKSPTPPVQKVERLPSSVVELLRQLKEAMKKEGVGSLEMTVDGEEMLVNWTRVVITNGLEVL